MIASNFRRYAEAMALQMPLQLGQRLRMALARPTKRAARLARSARGLVRRELLKRWTAWPGPKAKPVPQPAEREIWTQTRLWLYTAEQVELMLF